MKQRLKKEELNSMTDINYAIYILGLEINKCGVLLSYKRIKLEKTILTLQKIKDKYIKIDSELIETSGL